MVTHRLLLLVALSLFAIGKAWTEDDVRVAAFPLMAVTTALLVWGLP